MKGKPRKIQIELSEHEALLLLKMIRRRMKYQQETHCWRGYWEDLANQLQVSIETSYYFHWLIQVGYVLITGYIRPSWLLIKPLLGITERDQAGFYLISNEPLGLYAVGINQKEAFEDFKTSVVNNYQLLEASAGNDSDLQALLWEYQQYLKPPGKDYYLYS